MTAAPPPFSHLHLHTEYSILDGACQVSPLVKKIAELDMGYVGITDHGTMAGTVELYTKARKAGIKPVLGMEAYLTEDHMAKTLDDGSRSKTTHLTLFAENNEGWRNLLKLSSLSCLEGMYYKPRVDYEWMARHSKGIIALTGCMASQTQQHILDGSRDAAATEVGRLAEIFGKDNLYVEYQDNGVVAENGMSQADINRALYAIMKDQGLQGVVTSDVHYLNHSDAKPHDALLCIQTKARLSDTKRFRFSTDQFYVKTADEMWGTWQGFDPAAAEWFENTTTIGDRCNVELTLGVNLLPPFDCPEGHDADSYVRELCIAGISKRYGETTPEIAERLEFELSTIGRMGYSAYFLITWDWINWAKSQGIPVGPGRGSAAGSIVAYSLGITDVDPIRYDLLFERFLNPDRISMPDIDTDVAQYGRDSCIKYLTEKYGPERVAQVSTFGKMQPKAAVKDAARVMDYPVAIGEKVSKLIPDGPGQSFAKSMAAGTDLRKAYDSDETVKVVVDMAMPLEGMIRSTGIHACAVLIGDQPLADVVPLRAGEHGDQIVTQFEQSWCEELGLLKMDVLGLRNLDVIQKVVQFIEESRGETVDVANLPLDDPLTFEMIAAGDCTGVFQLESDGMQAAARQVRPTRFEDIVALVALYRPGPMEYIPVYAANKRDPEGIVYPDERLRPILSDTYGITCYQEQYMIIAKELAGFTPGQADELRKGIAKKNRNILDQVKPRFLAGCAANEVDSKVAARLWEDAEKAGDYSFNKSHAVCYALIAYQTAYLKAHYRSEYMAAIISTVMHTKDKVPYFVNACKKMGLDVLPPDVNESLADFRVLPDGTLRFGLLAVKGVGEAAIEQFIKVRETATFSCVWDFCERVDKTSANKRVLEALIKAGAFDSTGDTRRGMLDVLPQAMGLGQKVQADQAAGQFDLFGDMMGDAAAGDDDDSDAVFVKEYPEVGKLEFPLQEKLDLEKEATGLYMSGHPIDEYREALDSRARQQVASLVNFSDKVEVHIGGMIVGFRALVTKKGDPMAFAELEGTDGETVRLVILPKAYEKVREKITQQRAVIIVKGTMDARDGRADVLVDDVLTMDEAPQLTAVTVRAPENRLGEVGVISELTRILRNYPGEATVDVRVLTAAGEKTLRLGSDWRVSIDAGLKDEIRELLGPQAIV